MVNAVALSTCNKKFALAVCGCASVTVTVYSVCPLAVVVVPAMLPSTVLKINPVGNAGLIEYTNVPTPPEAVTGLNAVNAAFLINVELGIAVVTTIGLGAITAKSKVLVLSVCGGLA